MAVRVIVYWRTRNDKTIEAIRNRFRLPRYVTLNGWTPGAIEESDMSVFEETARRGFIRYMRKEWKFNGYTYSW